MYPFPLMYIWYYYDITHAKKGNPQKHLLRNKVFSIYNHYIHEAKFSWITIYIQIHYFIYTKYTTHKTEVIHHHGTHTNSDRNSFGSYKPLS